MEKLCILHFFAIHQSLTCPNAVIYPKCGSGRATIAQVKSLGQTFHMYVFSIAMIFRCPKHITTMHFNDFAMLILPFLLHFSTTSGKWGYANATYQSKHRRAESFPTDLRRD